MTRRPPVWPARKPAPTVKVDRVVLEAAIKQAAKDAVERRRAERLARAADRIAPWWFDLR
jgi:hypothetical protein